jgi:hypothetical protein
MFRNITADLELGLILWHGLNNIEYTRILDGRIIFGLILKKYNAMICLWVRLYCGISCFGLVKVAWLSDQMNEFVSRDGIGCSDWFESAFYRYTNNVQAMRTLYFFYTPESRLPNWRHMRRKCWNVLSICSNKICPILVIALHISLMIALLNSFRSIRLSVCNQNTVICDCNEHKKRIRSVNERRMNFSFLRDRNTHSWMFCKKCNL